MLVLSDWEGLWWLLQDVCTLMSSKALGIASERGAGWQQSVGRPIIAGTRISVLEEFLAQNLGDHAAAHVGHVRLREAQARVLPEKVGSLAHADAAVVAIVLHWSARLVHGVDPVIEVEPGAELGEVLVL